MPAVIKHAPGAPQKLGLICLCGEKFPSQKMLDEHLAKANSKEVKEETPVPEPKTTQATIDEDGVITESENTDTQPANVDQEVPTQVAMPPNQPAPKAAYGVEPGAAVVPQNSIAKASGEIAKLTNTTMAMELIKKNAMRILGDQRAEEFFTQLGFLMRKNAQLAQCTPDSIYSAMMQCVNLDIMPGTPEQYAAIIPYGKEAQFQLMYQGGMELAFRSGVVKTIKADLVFKEDDFDFDDATNFIHHKKNLTVDRTVAKDIIAAYAVAKLENGETQFIVMSPSEIAKIKRTVKANRPGTPWTDWEEKQVRKTAIKQLLKDLPGSRKDNRFKAAVAWDSANEGGRKMRADWEGNIIEGEMADVSLDTKEAINSATSKEELQKLLNGLSVAEQKLAAPLVSARMKEL